MVYDKQKNTLVFSTKLFGKYEEIVDKSYKIIDNIEACKGFVKMKRELLFIDILKKNNIEKRDGEKIILSDDGSISITTINDSRDIQIEDVVNISNISDASDIITLILEQRNKYDNQLKEKKKEMEERNVLNEKFSSEIKIDNYADNLEKF